MPKKFLFSAILSFVIFGSWAAISRSIHLDPMLMISLMSFSALIFGIVRDRPKLKQLIENPMSLWVGFNLTLDLFFLISAFRSLSIAAVITIHFLGPVYIALFSYIRNRDWSNFKLLLYVILGFLGVLVVNLKMFINPGAYSIVGVLFAIASSFTVAGNIVLQKQAVSKLPEDQKGNLGPLIISYNLWIFILSGAVCLFDNGLSSIFKTPPDTLFYTILAGIFVQYIALSLFNSAAKKLSTTIMGLISFSEIVWSIFIGILVYNEKIELYQILGFILIFMSIKLSHRYNQT